MLSFIFMCSYQLDHFNFSFIYCFHDHAWNLPMQLLIVFLVPDLVARSITSFICYILSLLTVLDNWVVFASLAYSKAPNTIPSLQKLHKLYFLILCRNQQFLVTTQNNYLDNFNYWMLQIVKENELRKAPPRKQLQAHGHPAFGMR